LSRFRLFSFDLSLFPLVLLLLFFLSPISFLIETVNELIKAVNNLIELLLVLHLHFLLHLRQVYFLSRLFFSFLLILIARFACLQTSGNRFRRLTRLTNLIPPRVLQRAHLALPHLYLFLLFLL
jgi:hypothetical protein